MMISTKSKRDLMNAKYRLRGHIFDELLEIYARRRATDDLQKKEIAQAWDKDPSVVTRLLQSPKNINLDTVAEFLQLLDAELTVATIDLRKAETASILKMESSPKTSGGQSVRIQKAQAFS